MLPHQLQKQITNKIITKKKNNITTNNTAHYKYNTQQIRDSKFQNKIVQTNNISQKFKK